MVDQTHITLPSHTELNADCVHRNQLVVGHYDNGDRPYVVVAVRDGAVRLQDPSFDGPAFWVEEDDWGPFEAKTARDDETPIWSY